MPRLQVVITERQETVLNAQAAAIGVALKEPVSVPDLIRMWVDQGCHMQPPKTAAVVATPEKALRAEQPAAADANAGAAPARADVREEIMKKAFPDEVLAELRAKMEGAAVAWADPSNKDPKAVEFRAKLKEKLTDDEIAILSAPVRRPIEKPKGGVL